MRLAGQWKACGTRAASIAFAVLALATACSSSSDTTLMMTADPATVAGDQDFDAAIQQATDVLRERVEQFDAGSAEITAEGERITVSVSGMDEEVARRLLVPRGDLEFRQPVVSDDGFVACQDSEGEEFYVHPLRVNPDSAARSLARCAGQDQTGDPQWEPTPTIFVRTQQLRLSELIEPGSWEIRDQTSLAVQFNDAGTELLEDVTGRLIGYPLGVFVDETLIGAPRIQRAITNGNPVISGFDEVEARIRRAQLNAPPLPVTLIGE